jgi:hypothetical protein
VFLSLPILTIIIVGGRVAWLVPIASLALSIIGIVAIVMLLRFAGVF